MDLLGKMNPVIAHSEPCYLDEFYPGHNKWDYRYSATTYQPDLITSLWMPVKRGTLWLIEQGIIPVNNGF